MSLLLGVKQNYIKTMHKSLIDTNIALVGRALIAGITEKLKLSNKIWLEPDGYWHQYEAFAYLCRDGDLSCHILFQRLFNRHHKGKAGGYIQEQYVKQYFPPLFWIMPWRMMTLLHTTLGSKSNKDASKCRTNFH